MSAEAVHLCLPPKADYLIVARLCAAAVAGRAGLDMEQIEDVRAAVAEACLWLLPRCAPGQQVRLALTVNNGIQVSARLDDACTVNDNNEAIYSRYLIEALMDGVQWPAKESGAVEIRMEKRASVV